ncbi:MAG: nuclear transport factor 2 family protein [Polyangiaceae bacterium]
MNKNETSFTERIRELLESLRPDDLDGVEKLRAVYDVGVIFEDPIQKVQGIEAFVALNRRLLGRAKELTFTVSDVAQTGDASFLTWTMRCVPKLGPTIHVDGATHLRVKNERVVSHRDYWDLGELFASSIPGGHRALRFLLKPMA